MKIIIAALLTLVLLAPAQAQDDTQWITMGLRSSCEWWENCNYAYWRQFYRDRNTHYRWRRLRYQHHHWVPAISGGETGPRCQPRRRVIGGESGSRVAASKSAELAWALAIRHDFGGRYANLDRAKDIHVICDPSSITTIVKRVLFACVLSATPCRASSHDIVTSGRRFDNDTVDIEVER